MACLLVRVCQKQKPQSKKISVEAEKWRQFARASCQRRFRCLLACEPCRPLDRKVRATEAREREREKGTEREGEGREIPWLTIGPSNASKIFFSYQQSEKP